MFKRLIIAAVTVSAIFGLSACGGASTEKKDGTDTTLRQKNGALVGTTIVKPKPIPATPVATTVPPLGATTVPKTVTTPVPNLPGTPTTISKSIPVPVKPTGTTTTPQASTTSPPNIYGSTQSTISRPIPIPVKPATTTIAKG